MIHIYTGKGKGKTTAAIGLAIRAAGAKKKVYIIQFLKKGFYNELKTLKKIKNIKLEQFGRGCLIKKRPLKKDRELAKKGLERCKNLIKQKKFDILILDEINVAIKLGLLNLRKVELLIKDTPENKDVILTGRCCPKKLIAIADYVSEINDLKHPFKHGIPARKGIEF